MLFLLEKALPRTPYWLEHWSLSNPKGPTSLRRLLPLLQTKLFPSGNLRPLLVPYTNIFQNILTVNFSSSAQEIKPRMHDKEEKSYVKCGFYFISPLKKYFYIFVPYHNFWFLSDERDPAQKEEARTTTQRLSLCWTHQLPSPRSETLFVRHLQICHSAF